MARGPLPLLHGGVWSRTSLQHSPRWHLGAVSSLLLPHPHFRLPQQLCTEDAAAHAALDWHHVTPIYSSRALGHADRGDV